MEVMIPLGIDRFDKLREDNYYYADKTGLIRELLNTKFEVNLITRPRRFGKTLMMSMLEAFFDLNRDSRTLFSGLNIDGETALCREWMNRWPTVFVSFKSAEGLNFDGAYGMLKVLIANLYKKYAFLEESLQVDEADRILFKRIKGQEESAENLKDSLLLLTRMLHAHYGKMVILLIDEYDVPLAKAHDNGYYKEMLDVMRLLLGNALKTNPHLKFSVITGCLKISKESIFTGLNNVVANTITVERFDEYFGFTEGDVRKLLLDTGFSGHAQEIREWYDGYRFGMVDVYCPWDVLNHTAALQMNEKAQPRNYWAATSHNDIIYKLLENREFDVDGKFEALLAGSSIQEDITEELTYDSIETSEKNLWSLLFMTGYLTLAKNPAGQTLLRIPNEEVKSIFQTTIVDWFKREVQTVDRTGLFAALWNGDAEMAADLISDLLFSTISYHDYRESYYHAFVAGLFAGAGYVVESNYVYGDGRPDVVVKEKKNRRVMLFEVKHTKEKAQLGKACEEAVQQIKKQRYALAFEGYRMIVSYGIAFSGKECVMRRAETGQ
ncbi:MAG: AAA family ATPase [Lachnospiraceae bacterium]|nr:AAA family ATPase [Lachnospiraceae bacterium]